MSRKQNSSFLDRKYGSKVLFHNDDIIRVSWILHILPARDANRSVVMLLLLLALFAVSSGLQAPLDDVTSYSVNCTSLDDSFQCIVNPFSASQWSARATLDAQSINTTGWGRLVVELNGDVDEETRIYAGGYIEGYISQELIDLSWVNQEVSVSGKAEKFIEHSLSWVEENAKSQGASSEEWKQAGLVLVQQTGLFDGYSFASKNSPAITKKQLLHYGMADEIDDIESAVNVDRRPNYNNMSNSEFRLASILRDHCSAMVKVTANFSDIYSAHVTWYDYSSMLRLFKSIMTVSSDGKSLSGRANGNFADVHYSGYPGKFASSDDYYYTSEKLTIWETSNSTLR